MATDGGYVKELKEASAMMILFTNPITNDNNNDMENDSNHWENKTPQPPLARFMILPR